MEIYLLLVDHKFQAIGSIFQVDIDMTTRVLHLLTKAMEVRPEVLSRAKLHPSDLTVWKTKGAMIIDKSTSKPLAEILGSINVEDMDTIEELIGVKKVADLGLSDTQTLLVRLPAVTLNGDLSEMDREYENIFLQASAKGNFKEEDINLNGIVDAPTDKAPEFVEKHEKMLGRKRKVANDIRASAETFVGEATIKEYFYYSTANVSGSIPIADRLEVSHLIHVSSVGGAKLWEFKEADANWLFFYAIARHFESLPSNNTSDGSEVFTVKMGQKSWPFPLIIQVENYYCTYRPKSDFLVLKFGLPRVAVEVNSKPSDRPAVDHHRMMLQGASIVRFANIFLDTYKKEKNFVFVAIFISDTGMADRYILYQAKNSQKNVHCKKRSFKLTIKDDRVRFALELYNLASALDDESDNEDTTGKVEKLAKSLDKLSKEHKLPTFTGKIKHTTSNDGGNQLGPRVRGKGGTGGTHEQLEAGGYEVVPDVFESDNGTWELLSKLPSHIRTVYRRSDPNKTEFIAKHLREGSDEMGILKYLHTIRPRSPHVISLIGTIPSVTGGWLILPKLHSICNQRLVNSGGVRGRVQLGRGLVEGLAYLHEHKVAHRDVKPDNLVCDDVFHLQIIDFDVAIQVRDENTEIDEYRGTKDWTAPEMGKQDGPTPMYSPIKADRWSCGRVLLRHIMVGKGDNRLSKFAEQLMANDPQQRPSLLEWPKWPAPPFSDVVDALKDGGKEVSRPRQDMVEVDGQSMKPPVAKKPRLAVTERGVQSELYGSQAPRPMDEVF